MAQLNAPQANYFNLQSIDGGVVYGKLPYKLADNQSPDMCNLLLDQKLLCKRRGVEAVYDGGAGSIAAVYPDFAGACWYASGNSLFALDYTAKTVTAKYTALSGTGHGTFFAYGTKLYYKSASDFLAIEPSGTVAPVTGYVPLILISCDPATGSGTENEALNRISAGFRVRYTSTGTVSTLKLPKALLPLDATAVAVDISGTAKAETTDFTVNRETGVLTVVGTAWPAGTNHITVTAYHTDAESAASIAGCHVAMPYGGDAAGLTGGTRIFFAGNAQTQNTVYYSGLLDPTYWPDNGFILIGQSDAAVTAFGKQYDLLYVFTARSLHSVQY
ncbi:MAG: hypothetical protein EOM69_05860, partial [Clostridia bacterium]|nr:hypothetical protein [Clostridia bacterium]